MPANAPRNAVSTRSGAEAKLVSPPREAKTAPPISAAPHSPVRIAPLNHCNDSRRRSTRPPVPPSADSGGSLPRSSSASNLRLAPRSLAWSKTTVPCTRDPTRHSRFATPRSETSPAKSPVLPVAENSRLTNEPGDAVPPPAQSIRLGQPRSKHYVIGVPRTAVSQRLCNERPMNMAAVRRITRPAMPETAAGWAIDEIAGGRHTRQNVAALWTIHRTDFPRRSR